MDGRNKSGHDEGEAGAFMSDMTIDYQTDPSRYRHWRIRFTVRPRESGDPGQQVSAVVWPWTPAFAGVSEIFADDKSADV